MKKLRGSKKPKKPSLFTGSGKPPLRYVKEAADWLDFYFVDQFMAMGFEEVLKKSNGTVSMESYCAILTLLDYVKPSRGLS